MKALIVLCNNDVMAAYDLGHQNSDKFVNDLRKQVQERVSKLDFYNRPEVRLQTVYFEKELPGSYDNFQDGLVNHIMKYFE